MKEQTPHSVTPFDKTNLIHPPGVINDIVHYTNTVASRIQPSFAVASALATLGALLGRGRTVAAENGMKTNLYFNIFGITGCGKNNNLVTPKAIMNNLLTQDILASEELTSGAALHKRLSHTPYALYLLDEIPDLMKIIAYDKGGHARDIYKVLKQLYSSANLFITGKELASTEKGQRKDIFFPHVSIIGAGTPEEFERYLNQSMLESGFLNRFINVFAPNEIPPIKPARPFTQIPPAILNKLSAFKHELGESSDAQARSKPIIIKTSYDAESLIAEYGNKITDEVNQFNNNVDRYMLSRCYENAYKVAIVLACSDAPSLSGAVIDKNHMRWAIDYVDFWTRYSLPMIEDNAVDSEHEQRRNSIVRAIKSCPKGATKASINRMSSKIRAISGRERNALIEECIELGVIEWRSIETPTGRKGKPRLFIVK